MSAYLCADGARVRPATMTLPIGQRWETVETRMGATVIATAMGWRCRCRSLIDLHAVSIAGLRWQQGHIIRAAFPVGK